MSSKKGGSAKVPQVEMHEEQPAAAQNNQLFPAKAVTQSSNSKKIKWIILAIVTLTVIAAIAISVIFIFGGHNIQVKITNTKQLFVDTQSKTLLLQSTIIDLNQDQKKPVNVTIMLKLQNPLQQGRLLTETSSQYEYSIFYRDNQTGITVKISKNESTKFYVDIDSLAAYIEANYYQVLTQNGTVSRSILMEALYAVFHKQSNSSLAQDSTAQEESVFIDISINDKGEVAIIPKQIKDPSSSRRLQSKSKKQFQIQQPLLLRLVKSLLPSIKEKAAKNLIPFLSLIGMKIEELVPGIVGKVASHIVQNVPTITKTVVDTCFPNGFTVISCKAKELMLALSGQSGGLESVIQIIKHKFFDTLQSSNPTITEKQSTPIPVKSGSGMQKKVAGDQMANYMHFYGVGEL